MKFARNLFLFPLLGLACFNLQALQAADNSSLSKQISGVIQRDKVQISGEIEHLSFNHESQNLFVTTSGSIVTFDLFPIIQINKLEFDDISINSSHITDENIFYAVGINKHNHARLVIGNIKENIIYYERTIPDLFVNPNIFVTKKGDVYITNLVSNTVEILKNINLNKLRDDGRTVKTYEPPDDRIVLRCGNSQKTSLLPGSNLVLSSIFGRGIIEFTEIGGWKEKKCGKQISVVNRLPPEGEVFATMAHAFSRMEGEDTHSLTRNAFFANVESDELIAMPIRPQSPTISMSVVPTMLNLADAVKTWKRDYKANIKGDVHIAVNSPGDKIAVGSPFVSKISFFDYSANVLQLIGTHQIGHVSDSLALSNNGELLAVAENRSDGSASALTVLRNPALNQRVDKIALRKNYTTEWAQQILNKLGHKVGVADGLMGKKTKSAILKFQKASEIEPNGILTTETKMKLLESVLEKN